jgi:hypothetical protein
LGPGPDWTGAENLAPTAIRSPDRPDRNQSQYRLKVKNRNNNSAQIRDLTHAVNVKTVLLNPKQYLEYVVPFAVENHDALVKMVVLHGTGLVQNGERGLCLCLKGVVGPSVIQIVAETGHKQPQDLNSPHAIKAKLLQRCSTKKIRVFLDVT